ncbi:OsmC-related (seleno)protein [Microbulbifer sp. ANSA003]|uniref:OsmC-related (seleno)protein n=1 Tax=unclassified Microbulbifer TaxID=2619833 RepID=UPI00403A1978
MSFTGEKEEKISIVRKVRSLPTLQEVQVKEPQKDDGSFYFQVNLSAKTSVGDGFLKTGVVQASVPGCSAFELRCDEGSIIGGADSAPAPLDYLSAGIAFCFLSHISIYINSVKLKVDSVRLEQQMRFKAEIYNLQNSTDDQPHKGLCEGIDIFVFVESEEPRQSIERMVAACRTACMGLQTAINSVPAEVSLIYNDP